MRRYPATCDDCPDWTYLADTEAAAQRVAGFHATDVHAEDLRTTDTDAFLRSHAPLAHRFARKAGLMNGETYDEVYADAMIGLWDAAKRYDPARGWTFATFAGHRITGAITDGRRQRDPMSRRCRRQGVEMPLHLDMPTGDGITLADTLIDPTDNFAAVDDADLHSRRLGAVYALLPSLTANQRHVLLGRMAGEKLHVLGAQLGVTESRASQIADAAVTTLRRLLTAA